MNPITRRGVMILVVAAVLTGGLAVARAADPQPEIFIPKMRHDFGKLFEQKSYEYTFVIHNKGKADLVLESVKPG
jgi:hypothetical protein